MIKSALLNIAYTVKYLQQNTAAQLTGDIVVAEYRKIVKAAHADTAEQRLNLLKDSNKVSDILLQKLKQTVAENVQARYVGFEKMILNLLDHPIDFGDMHAVRGNLTPRLDDQWHGIWAVLHSNVLTPNREINERLLRIILLGDLIPPNPGEMPVDDIDIVTVASDLIRLEGIDPQNLDPNAVTDKQLTFLKDPAAAKSLLPADVPGAIAELHEAIEQVNRALATFYDGLKPLEHELNHGDDRFKIPKEIRRRLYAIRMATGGIDPRITAAWNAMQEARSNLEEKTKKLDTKSQVGVQDMQTWPGKYESFLREIDAANKALARVPVGLPEENGYIQLDGPNASTMMLINLGKDGLGNRHFYQSQVRRMNVPLLGALLSPITGWFPQTKAIIHVDREGHQSSENVPKELEKRMVPGAKIHFDPHGAQPAPASRHESTPGQDAARRAA